MGNKADCIKKCTKENITIQLDNEDLVYQQIKKRKNKKESRVDINTMKYNSINDIFDSHKTKNSKSFEKTLSLTEIEVIII